MQAEIDIAENIEEIEAGEWGWKSTKEKSFTKHV